MAVRALTLAPQSLSAGVAAYQGYEGASEAFGRGAVLVEDAAQLDEAAATLVTPAGTIVGVSADAASGTAGTVMGYYPALPHIVFEANLSTGPGDPPTAYVLLVGDFLTNYGMSRDTSQTPDVWYVDQSQTASDDVAVKIIGFRDPVGTSDARVYFVFLVEASVFNVSIA